MMERRRHFLINKPLQLRYMLHLTLTLFAVSSVIIISLYFGIWGGMLEAFSDEQVLSDLLTASRISQYEDARIPHPASPALAVFKQAEKLSLRQQEIFKTILDETNHKLLPKLFALFFLIGWGSIYLSHKIAGPFYRLQTDLSQISRGNMKTRMWLRKGDEGQFVGRAFNQTAESLDARFCRLKKILSESSDAEAVRQKMAEELSKITTSADS